MNQGEASVSVQHVIQSNTCRVARFGTYEAQLANSRLDPPGHIFNDTTISETEERLKQRFDTEADADDTQEQTGMSDIPNL
jgi:hypothetical protein